MELLGRTPSSYYDTLKRYWKRRKYQRLNPRTRHGSIFINRLNITRLMTRKIGPHRSRRHYSKLCPGPKLGFKMISPFKLLSKFHDAYVETMVRLAAAVDRSGGHLGGSKVRKGRVRVCHVSSGEEVDSGLVVEIYKRFSASRESYVA